MNTSHQTPTASQFVLSVAPMMSYTDIHFRYLMRLISKNVVLYTEMAKVNEILYKRYVSQIQFSENEHPIVLQLGGGVPNDFYHCMQKMKDSNFDEININVGCPTRNTKKPPIGAHLMNHPGLVRECIEKIQEVTETPVSIKTRIGVDESDSLEFLQDFLDEVLKSGIQKVILHARKAYLKGLNTSQNRNVPPLNYDRVHTIKSLYPNLKIEINGGINTIEKVKQQVGILDGAMIGREAYHNPFFIHDIEKALNWTNDNIDKKSIMQSYFDYTEAQLSQNQHPHRMLRHVYSFISGLDNAKCYKQQLNAMMGPRDINLDKFFQFTEGLIDAHTMRETIS